MFDRDIIIMADVNAQTLEAADGHHVILVVAVSVAYQ